MVEIHVERISSDLYRAYLGGDRTLWDSGSTPQRAAMEVRYTWPEYVSSAGFRIVPINY